MKNEIMVIFIDVKKMINFDFVRILIFFVLKVILKKSVLMLSERIIISI